MSSRDQSFSCLIKKALLIGELIMTKITHQVNKQHLIGSIPRSKNARYYFQLGKHGGLVSDNINKNNWEFGQSTSESPERVLISVPYVWMYYFDLCSSFRCPISELIDQFLFKSETYCLPEFDDQFREIIKKRIHLCNDLYIFNEQNNFLTSNLFRYGHLKKLSNSSRA